MKIAPKSTRPYLNATTLLRWFFTILLAVGVYRDTNWFIASVIALILLHNEINNILLHMIVERLKGLES